MSSRYQLVSSRYHQNPRRRSIPLENIGIHHQNRREKDIPCLLGTNVSSRYHFVSSRYHFVSFEYLNTLGALLSQGFEGNPLYTYIPILENRFVSSRYQLCRFVRYLASILNVVSKLTTTFILSISPYHFSRKSTGSHWRASDKRRAVSSLMPEVER